MTGLALSPDGKILAVAADGLQLWSTATGQRIGSTLPAADAGGPVAFSPDGSLVAAIGTDGKARLWKVATQQETGTAVTVGPGASQGALAFSPDGKTFATVGANGTAALWSVATQRRIGALMTAGGRGLPAPSGRGQAGRRGRVQPGRRHARHRGRDGSIRLWDAATQQEIGTPMTAGPEPVYALAFSPDGATLATAGGDGSARLWDAATQQEIGTPMTAGPGPVYALAFSPDGATLATAGRRRRAPASGTWPSRPGCWPPPAPSRTNPSPASSGLTTLGPSRSSRSAPRAKPVARPCRAGTASRDRMVVRTSVCRASARTGTRPPAEGQARGLRPDVSQALGLRRRGRPARPDRRAMLAGLGAGILIGRVVAAPA